MTKLKGIKEHFPIFKTYPKLIFADSASTSQKPSSVINAISDYYKTSNANVHRAVYDLGIKSDEIFEQTRNELCEFYSKEACVFTAGTTDGLNKLARGLESEVGSKDNMVVSEMEHHSNLVPWQELCRRTGAELRVVRITDSGELDFQHFSELVDDHTRVVSLIHISNTLGTINDLSLVSKSIQDKDCVFIVDAAQSCTLYPNLIKEIDADAIVFGAHKMFGPSGLGVILARKRFLKSLPPFNLGGGMVTEVEKQHSAYRNDIARFEGGTPPLAQVAGLRASLEFIKELDIGQCQQHVCNLGIRLRKELKNRNVQVLGNPKNPTGIVSATFGDIHPHDVASFLNSKNIAVRAGHHCTQLIMKKYGIHSSVRFSFSIYNELEDISTILEAIKEMNQFFS